MNELVERLEKTPIAWPITPCCTEDYPACICGVEERALRGWISGDTKQAMTPEQREYCLREIEQIEGYERKDGDGLDDAALARLVISAWTDYCRDKGLL